MWPSWRILLCFLLTLASSGQPVAETPGGPGELRCGLRGFQFTVDLPGQKTATPVLRAWDNRGLPHRLKNDSDCGTRVQMGPGSSMVLEATYAGCYVTKWGSHYIMPVGVEGTDAAGHKTVMKRRLLKCPVDLPVWRGETHEMKSPRPPHPRLTRPGLRLKRSSDAPQADLCDGVPVRDRLPCAASPISQGDCKALGCCFSSGDEGASSCYYGNTVTSHCTRGGHFSIAVPRNVTSPSLRLDSVHLVSRNDRECDPVTATHAFILFQFPFTSCGTTRRITGDQVVYENELVATRDVRAGDHGSITRDGIFRLRVSCSYSINSNSFPVNIQVFTLPPPLPKTQPGPLSLELQIAKDKNYGSYYAVGDYPVVKLLRDPVYVEVSIAHRTDPFLGLHLQQCWATPSPNPQSQPQWPILEKGCAYAGDNYQTQLIPVQKPSNLPFPSHHQRFSISTFSFVDSAEPRRALGGQVYLHCSVSICQPAGTPSCMVTCPGASRRRKSDFYFQNNTASISSQGPMILLQASEDPSENPRVPVDPKTLWVAGLSGSFILGALLVSWLAIRKRR